MSLSGRDQDEINDLVYQDSLGTDPLITPLTEPLDDLIFPVTSTCTFSCRVPSTLEFCYIFTWGTVTRPFYSSRACLSSKGLLKHGEVTGLPTPLRPLPCTLVCISWEISLQAGSGLWSHAWSEKHSMYVISPLMECNIWCHNLLPVQLGTDIWFAWWWEMQQTMIPFPSGALPKGSCCFAGSLYMKCPFGTLVRRFRAK